VDFEHFMTFVKPIFMDAWTWYLLELQVCRETRTCSFCWKVET